jgi:hypothetical protein
LQVLKLVSQELTIEALLEMTAVQLADSSTQQRRQQQLSNVVLDAMRESTQETLENARREVMAGTDVSSAGSQSAVPLTEDLERPGLSRESSMDVDRSPGKEHGDSHDATEMDVDANEDEARDVSAYESAPSSRSLEIEQRVNAGSSPRATAVPKRPMDADAISRFTTSSARPNKLPRVDTEDASSSNTVESGKSPRGLPKESPRVKPPSLLGNILANKAAVAAAAANPHAGAGEPDYEELEEAIHRSKAADLSSSVTLTQNPVVDAVKLINASGGNEISIARPGHGSGSKSIVMKGEAWVTDRYVIKFPLLATCLFLPNVSICSCALTDFSLGNCRESSRAPAISTDA